MAWRVVPHVKDDGGGAPRSIRDVLAHSIAVLGKCGEAIPSVGTGMAEQDIGLRGALHSRLLERCIPLQRLATQPRALAVHHGEHLEGLSLMHGAPKDRIERAGCVACIRQPGRYRLGREQPRRIADTLPCHLVHHGHRTGGALARLAINRDANALPLLGPCRSRTAEQHRRADRGSGPLPYARASTCSLHGNRLLDESPHSQDIA